MKKLILIFLLLAFLFGKFSATPQSEAIRDVTSQLFTTKTSQIPFDFIFFEKFSIDMKNDLKVQIKRLKSADHERYRGRSSVVLVENMRSAWNYLRNIESKKRTFPERLKCLVYVDKVETLNLILQISQIPYSGSINKRYLPGNFIHYVYFLLNYESKMDLLTFEWFTEKRCQTPQLSIINTFNKKTRKWLKELKIEEKFRKFHNCSIDFRYVSQLFTPTSIMRKSRKVKGK